MDDVADKPDFGLQELLLLGGRGKQFLLLLLNVGWNTLVPCTQAKARIVQTFLLQKIGNILLGLHTSDQN